LVDSLVSVFAAGDTTEFVGKIDTLANKIADTVSAVVFGFRKLYVLTSDRAILASFNPFDDYEKNALAAIEAAEKAAKARRNTTTMGYLGSQPVGIYETGAQASARKKAEADAAKRAKELAKLAAGQKALQVTPTAAPMKTLEQARTEAVTSVARVNEIYTDLMSKINATTKDNSPTVNVKVEVGGQQLTDVVTTQQLNNSASGIRSSINRTNFAIQ
jgi:hypothetical protein